MYIDINCDFVDYDAIRICVYTRVYVCLHVCNMRVCFEIVFPAVKVEFIWELTISVHVHY